MHRKSIIFATAALVLLATSMTVLAQAQAQSQVAVGETQAAQNLYSLGLFMGDGRLADGSPNFRLDRHPTRAEAIAMFVRLVGGAEEAHGRTWDIPFTDVPSWARPYVGYAWHNNLAAGVSATLFGSQTPITAAQYITFVLRALGYSSDTDFAWNTSWTLSDAKGITDGRFNANTNNAFTRGGLALVSFNALGGTFAGSSETLADALVGSGIFTQVQAQAAGIGVATADAAPVATVAVGDIIQFGPYEWRVLDVQGNQALILTDGAIDNRHYHHTMVSVTWETSDIRGWLNSDFLDRFSQQEQARIVTTTLVNRDNQWFGTSGGNSTQDRVFLLSIEEVVLYFGDSGRLANRPSDAWFIINDQFGSARQTFQAFRPSWASRWWLRSPGWFPYRAAYVTVLGDLSMQGISVNWRQGVRPALWLNLGP